jgi:isopenicillin-N N-acyltransferase-like protein
MGLPDWKWQGARDDLPDPSGVPARRYYPARFEEERDVVDVQVPTVEYRKGIYYLVLDGETPYERGYQHGAALEFPIKKALRQFRAWVRDVVGLEEPEAMILEFAESTPYMASVQADAPDLLAEMRGVAEGAGVDLKQLFVYQSFDEFFVFLLTSGTLDMGTTGHCTTAGVYGRPDKPNYVGHNNDIPTYHEELVTVLHIKYPDSATEVLQSTFAGQIGQNGVNNRGVAVGINTQANLPAGDGLPVSFHVRRVLESESVDGAVAYLQDARFAQAMNYTIGDREQVVCVETWQDDALVLNGDGDDRVGGWLAHTNHALGEGTPKTFEMTDEMGGGSYGHTVERLALASELLSADTGGVTLESFQKLFRTRPILVHPGKPTGRTLMNMVAEIPRQGGPVLHLTPDSPNMYDHARFSF